MILLNHLKQCSSVVSPLSGVNFDLKYSFCTDSRKYHHPSVFVALPGAKINPLDVVETILQQNCPIVVYQNSHENSVKVKALSARYPKTTFIEVSDSVQFLQELSQSHIRYWKNLNPRKTIFAISGSNGKTTHKEMLSFILKSFKSDKIVATEKNNNNHLGVPLTLLQVTDETEFVVLELGSNHPGEIKVLCDIAKPNAGITTNIGATHLEFFGDEEKVFAEEGYLYYAVKENTSGRGFFLINLDDKFLKSLPLFPGAITYGSDVQSMARVIFSEKGAELSFGNGHFFVENQNITGRHNKLNLITCVLIAYHFYPAYLEQILEAARSFVPTKNRSEWILAEGASVYLDAYNANPSSMKAALEAFKESVLARGYSMDESCIVLGDMNELGDLTADYHRETAKVVKDLGFKNVYFIGRFSSFYRQGHSAAQCRSTTLEFKHEYRSEILKKYRIHFIKGSRSLQLESLFDIT